ncbi:MAG: ExeA family protein, partial [Paracoccaceae bacterium]
TRNATTQHHSRTNNNDNTTNNKDTTKHRNQVNITNINANKDELLQLVLVGQPELRDIVHRPDLTQFAQRVAANFHLKAMDSDTVRDYIHHRLEVAGAKREIFSTAATEMIFAATGGVPRLVNQLCDLSMLYAYTDNQQKVTGAVVHQVLGDGVFFGGGAVPGEKDKPVFQTRHVK